MALLLLSMTLPLPSAAAFVRPLPTPIPKPISLPSRNHCRIRRGGRLILSSDRSHDALGLESGNENDTTESYEQKHLLKASPPISSSAMIETRRRFFQQQIIASTFLPTLSQAATTTTDSDNGYFSLRNNNNVSPNYAEKQRLLREAKLQQKEQAENRKKKIISIKRKWTPFANVNKWDSVETCLLEMLPVRNPVFRSLQDLIQDLEIHAASDSEGWKETLLDVVTIMSSLDSKRAILEPVFNQEDPTELYISKSSLGEKNIEALRKCLEELITIASGKIELDMNARATTTVNVEITTTDDMDGPYARRKGSTRRDRERKRELQKKKKKEEEEANNEIDDIDMEKAGDIDVEAFVGAKRQALLALSELGELLVPSFPYAVPTRGKFGYLPRLLGRCSVTLSFERPSSPSAGFLGVNFNSIGINNNDKQTLGNVTFIADGYAAPITAGNFVDLSVRNFYTGLSVKAMRKRLGLVPTMSDNVIMNDLTELKDNLDSALEFQETLIKDTKAGGKSGDSAGGPRRIFRSSNEDYDESRMTMDVVLPVLGSFQEGFYDPLTAKPRRIPLEVVALDANSPTKSTLTYSSNYASLDDDAANTDAGTTTYSALISSSSPQRSFSSSTSSSSSNSTAAATTSNLDPVLSFNIPGLVALNHPDRASNGASSEFFALPKRDVSSKRSKLLDGQYAPFGYIVSGSEVYQSLRPGDVISATYVSEVGLLNLVKIRKNAFEGDGEDAIVEDKDGD
eukprot:CAMPEP_0183721056 /NCGR_PEP_ID=MMETSP0737-20130205/13484_1 /TAXON_ID=385413 /ORGANISM="Thalassiosira miniscula, Strain CCMP1093" /LENGTH=740 /DNA_ID=CAMNT_0025951025 /DNA_START=181 /DNA_END=2403 /DNA_ORIENTATION=-